MTTPRRVLVVQPYGIGDLLFVTPVLRALRNLPAVERVDLLLGSRTDAVVQNNPHINEIEIIDKDIFHARSRFENLSAMMTLGKKLQKRKYDLLLDYSLRGEYAFFSQFFLGIPVRAGFNYKHRGFFHNLKLNLPEGFKDRHVVDYFCDLAEKAGVPVEDRFLEYYVTGPERFEAGRMIDDQFGTRAPFLAVSPGGGESWGKDAHFKRWPARYFAELINRLKETLKFEGALILGSPAEKPLADELAGLLKMKNKNLAGEISFRKSAALLEQAAFFAGNDGGLMHLAHSFQIPLVSFYGPVDPLVYGPYPPSPEALAVFKEGLECRPCYQKFRYNAACAERECLQHLMPAEALEFMKKKDLE